MRHSLFRSPSQSGETLAAKKSASRTQPQSLDSILKSKGLKKILPFLGPAFIASVAYIDPGNFATNIQAGSEYGYLLLWVILASNLMAILVQSLSAKLGIATGKNLPEISREHFPRWASIGLWIQGEIIIMATDLAEFIGAALGLYLIFGLPMLPSALITACASFLILELQRKGFRPLEAVIAGMVLLVVLAFGTQVVFSQPELAPMMKGLVVPRFDGVSSILLAAGILGATVMPHAIYLHSGLTNKRIVGKNEEQRVKIFKFEFIDILIAMIIAGIINASMLVVASALFNTHGMIIEDLDVAFDQFNILLGPAAAIIFGIGLLSSGLSSSSVGTLSGDIIMQGYIRKRIPIYLRRAITMIPPLTLIIFGVNPTYALVMSQVVLSFGIAFALIPLIIFTSKKNIMGQLANHKITTIIAWGIAVLVIALNLFLLYETIFGA
ncbi:manganese transport protein [Pullulanibacillus pueri]|uniref:Divalent metal cation transporter MntH n=1 Tax=Pullulanibacillus pueri TaxID=1437324 RepID=A0A8J3ENX4_9BACL|nr:Nramp family divalent metal transporter [Pullulanibacillus pueri]MBM7683454.1 manganese transport protein [Pullulanibacillus pueri]GGH87450.1 divalent metal cation transporter MntH [Pullulanibacillus pueri]